MMRAYSARLAAIAAATFVGGTLGIHAAGQDVSPALASAALARTIDQVRGLDADALVARGLHEAPSLQAARSDVDAARGRERQAALRANPMVSAERREQLGGTDVATEAGLEWPLEWGRLAPRRALAEAERARLDLSRADEARRLAAAIRSAYGDVLAEARVLEVALAQLGTANDLLSLTAGRAAQGMAPVVERDQASVEVSRLKAQVRLAEGRLDTARLALARVVGVAPGVPFTVRGTLEGAVSAAPPEGPPTASAERSAERPDVQAAAADVSTARARGDLAHAEGRVDLSVMARYMLMDNGFPQFGVSSAGAPVPIAGRFHTITAGVVITLPFMNKREGDVAAAHADMTAAGHRLDAARLDVLYETAAARARMDAADAALAEYRAGALAAAHRSLGVAREAYALGARTLVDVFTEVRRVQDVEMAYTEALRERYQAGVALGAARGRVE